jgi:hypothetical protein
MNHNGLGPTSTAIEDGARNDDLLLSEITSENNVSDAAVKPEHLAERAA